MLIAKFIPSVRTGVAPLKVDFLNSSEGFSSCRWNFNNEGFSNLVNPSFQFNTNGVKDVTLTVFDDMSGTSQFSTTINIFSDSDYSTTSTTQQALFTSKRFETGVGVKKTLLDGSIVQTLYPLSGTNGGFSIDASPFAQKLIVSASTGSSLNQVQYDTTTYPLVTTYVDLGWTAYLNLFLKSGATIAGPTSAGHQMFTYKIISRSGANLTLDRPTPRITNGSTPFTFAAAILISNSAGTATNTMFTMPTITSCLQVSPTVDSLETLNIPGIYQPSVRGSGTFKYFSNDNNDGSSKLFIVPSRSSWNTVESWKPSTVRLSLPYILWHRKSTAGVSLIDSNETMVDEITDQLYGNLRIENEESIVGRVFYESKMIVIDDVELQASLNYLSNRNYTLPAPTVTYTTTLDPTGGLRTGCTYFVTYRCRDDSSYSGGVQFGNSGISQMHCRYIQQITPSSSGYKFRIQAPASLWYVSSRGTNNTGFTAPVVDILIASAETGQTLSDATWYYTGNVGTYANLNSGIEVQFPTGGTITAATFATMPISGNSYLKYGDDPIILGYFSAISQSTIYKMSATLVAKNTEFNKTQNDSFVEGVNESVYITEAALYNENNELLMIGKLNNPIEKNDKKFVTIKMELDL